MKIGHVRVSTDEQNLALQRDALEKAGCKRFVSDKGVSGNSNQRDGLDRTLKQLKKGDVLVVWKLDRLGRSLRHLIEFIETLRVKGVGFQSLTDGISTTTAGGQLVFHIVGALAIYYSRYNYHP